MLLCKTASFFFFFDAGVACLCWFCRELCRFILVCRQCQRAQCFMTNQHFVFTTKILKSFYQKKKKEAVSRNSPLASRKLGSVGIACVAFRRWKTDARTLP
uniref:Putative secreted protein n=1 Tax=Ixodes ricinus TaxID=34613 RepID=A0A6B0U981_IXORI